MIVSLTVFIYYYIVAESRQKFDAFFHYRADKARHALGRARLIGKAHGPLPPSIENTSTLK
jgi:hypothetical protein